MCYIRLSDLSDTLITDEHGNGIKDRDDKSIGIEIFMTEVLTKINPTDPLMLSNQVHEIDPIPPVITFGIM